MKFSLLPVRMRRMALLPAAACLIALGGAPAQATIIADFSGGNGEAQANQYTGKAGDGWLGAWNARIGQNATNTFSVLNTNPFGSGGNYLNIIYSKTASGGSNRGGVSRAFATVGAGSVDVTKQYSIAFDFRVESLTGWSGSGDQFVFSSESTTTIGSIGSELPWSLTIRGDNGFAVTNGNGTGSISNLNFSSLGLTALAANTVYSVNVTIDPLHNGYDLTITRGGTTYRASDLNGGKLLGFRTNATAANANVLQFRNIMDGATDATTWSLDNIAVIPEPGSVALVLGGALCFAWKLRQGLPSRH